MPGRTYPPTVRIVLGTAGFGSVSDPQAKFNDSTTATPLLDAFRAHGHNELDTARAYPIGAFGTAEQLLGDLKVGEWATIDTKVKSWAPHAHTKENIEKSIGDSLASLKVDSVHIMYLHAPDRTTPFEETCRAMNAAYQAGKFERFGLSNFTAAEVEEICGICEREGLVKPTAYQCKYSIIARGSEKELFPILRKHGISFYAYSPSAGGFFSGKVTRESVNSSGSRWDQETFLGKIYQSDYFKDEIFEAAARVNKSAAEAGLTGHGVALRWTLYHSMLKPEHGDAIIVGCSSLKQMEQNLESVEQGPLSKAMVDELEAVWKSVEKTAPSYHK
ncbi:MAG: hypothetical protein Q9163_002685 [Psora crenata]